MIINILLKKRRKNHKIKKKLLVLTLSVICTLLLCMNAFALTLDTAEAFSEAFVSDKDASLSDANEFDLIFFEDFEGFTAPTKIVTGGFAPMTTAARIDYIGGNWMDFSEKFYIYAVQLPRSYSSHRFHVRNTALTDIDIDMSELDTYVFENIYRSGSYAIIPLYNLRYLFFIKRYIQ